MILNITQLYRKLCLDLDNSTTDNIFEFIDKESKKVFQKLIPGARHDQHDIIKAAGHFLQDDKGEEIASKMIEFILKK